MTLFLKLSAASLALVAAAPAVAQDIDALREMSIDDLAHVNVMSVSKTEQPLADAPAAIYVIGHDDIVRSGASTLPEMLRLAPNLQVYRRSPADWVVTARGFNGNSAAQSYSNKLLVLIDGRPVYTPLFSGVYWDMPDVMPDDIDRIEVISGPGATQWGANAVNGVINVITRNSLQLGGVHADLRAGPDRQSAGLRFGGRAGDEVTYQVHARALREDAFALAGGASAEDDWRRIGGGFRIDWTPATRDAIMLEGEIFDGRLDHPAAANEAMSGHHLTLRWNRQTSDTDELQAQLFYDRIARDARAGGGGKFTVDTYDAEIQHRWRLGESHTIVAGAGARLADYRIDGTQSFFFDPTDRGLFIANAFVQDSFALTPALTAVVGLKLERLPFAGVSLLPEFRLAWKPAPSVLLWGAVSRAVRSPTPFDTDVEERAGPVTLSGNPEFRTEKLTAVEVGTRMQPARAFSFSVAGFYHRYDDMRTIEIVPGPGLSLSWGNALEGEIYGVDAWGELQATPWWTLGGGLTLLERDLRFKPGASGILGPSQLGNDPPYVVKLRSAMNLGRGVTLDLNFRAYGKLRDSTVQDYRELGGRLAWEVSPQVTLSLVGSDLLHAGHQEYPGGDFAQRRVMAGAELSF